MGSVCLSKEVVSKNESLVARTDCHKVLPPTGDKLLPDLVHRSVDGATSQSNIYTSSPPLSSTADNSQLTSSSLTVLRLTQTVVDSSGDELSQPTPVVKSRTLPVSGKLVEFKSATSITLCPVTVSNETTRQQCLPAIVNESQTMSQSTTKSMSVQSPTVAAIASSLFGPSHQLLQGHQQLPQTKTTASGHSKTTCATTNSQSVARPSSAGTRVMRPNQPLPPVRTSSCLSKSSTLPASMLLTDSYEEVPVHEPDLTRQPVRSALKGSKSTVTSQSFHQQLERALTLQMSAGCQPFPVDPGQPCHTACAEGDANKTGQKHVSQKQRAVGRCISNGSVSSEHTETYDNVPAGKHTTTVPDALSTVPVGLVNSMKQRHRENLARLLRQRPAQHELIERNILCLRTEQERREDRQRIGTRLNRRLSLRPTADELEEKNILHSKLDEWMESESSLLHD